MLRQHGNDDRRVFRDLAFVDGYGVSRHQGVKLTEAVGDGTAVEARSELATIKVDIHDIADVAVINLLVVIVLDLHDLLHQSWDDDGNCDPFTDSIHGDKCRG